MFQSSPSPKAGSYHRPSSGNVCARWFQSSPSPKAGSYIPAGTKLTLLVVSILSQPEGRELLVSYNCICGRT